MKKRVPKVGEFAVYCGYSQKITDVAENKMYLFGGMKTAGWVLIEDYEFSEILNQWENKNKGE